jgi:hypothetical protein
VFAASLEEEPYNIDELRQTRYYEAPFGFLVDSAFAQDQPPLDPVLNALLQRVIGQGDWQQRLLSAVFGLAGIAVFASLLRRRGAAAGTPVAILLLGLSPLLVTVFVYARPYALPFFLTAAFLYLTDSWLTDANRASAAGLIVVALLLPLSRTLEPNMVLGLTAVTLLGLSVTGGARRLEGSVWLPVGACFLGLIAVGLPVFLRLRNDLTVYTDGGLLPSFEQVQRLFTDLPAALAAVIPGWPVALVLAGWALSRKGVRSWIAATWWSWIWLLVPVFFVLLFLLTTNPEQPLFGRYFFTWVPALALLATVVMDDVVESGPVVTALSVGAAVVLIAWSAVSLIGQYRAKGGDWEALSDSIVAITEPSTLVLLESPVPIGTYRTPFAGRPRYLPAEWSAPRVVDLVGDPDLLGEDQSFVFAWSSLRVDIPGWDRKDIDAFFSVYAPEGPAAGKEQAAETMLSFAELLDEDRGGTLTLAAAALYQDLGHESAACELIGRLDHPADLAARAHDLIEAMDSPLLGLDCPSITSFP